MSLLMKRSFNLLKAFQYKSIRNFCKYSITHSKCNRLLFNKNLALNGFIKIRYLSSDISDLNEDLSSNTSEDFVKNTEISKESMDSMSDYETNITVDNNIDEIQRFWTKHDIQVHGRDPPLPILKMDDYKWPEKIERALEMDGFTDPTPIQCQGWPIVMSGRDMVGVAQTGSGKTLCYVLPAFVKLDKEGAKRGPKCLILGPTRELVQQIRSVVQRFAFVNSVCLFGGASRLPQMEILRKQNPQILIATPGRMIDFVESSVVDLRTIDYLVLDEADRMLDMGFEPQIKRIIENMEDKRQTVMWSATWPQQVKQLAAKYMKDYIQINVGGDQLMANKNIEQKVIVCEYSEKKQMFFNLLNEIKADSRENKTLIFAKTKHSVDYLTKQLRDNGWPTISIHGDKSQAFRDRMLSDFRSARFSILVATDVAARGLDVDDIKYVINYDYPNTAEDYVHRIGRTGRMDKKGTAYTFMSSNDAKQAKDLIEVLRESNQTVCPKLLELSKMTPNVSNTFKRRRFSQNNFERNMFSGSDRQRNYNFDRFDEQRHQSNYRSDYGNDSDYGYNRPNFRSNSNTNYSRFKSDSNDDRNNY